MNVLLLNVSPKSRGSASAFYTSLLRLFLTGCKVQVCQLRRAGDHENVFALLPWADAVVISAPLYVDAAPAHVAAFLEQAQQRCKETPCRFTLYAISNCGFPEGHQNELHLRIYEAWCRCAGVSWGGGLGIGGGVILRWMCMLTPLFAVLDTARLILAAQAAPLTVQTILSCYSSMLVTLAMSLGAVICLAILGHRIKRGACRKNLFTRCLMPSFVFIPVSDAFMLLSALAHGKLPHTLFRRQPPSAQKTDLPADRPHRPSVPKNLF